MSVTSSVKTWKHAYVNKKLLNNANKNDHIKHHPMFTKKPSSKRVQRKLKELRAWLIFTKNKKVLINYKVN